MTPPTAWRELARADAVWAFDVDGTLIGSVRSDVLRPGAVALLDALIRRGVTCVLWSAGGEDYARRMSAAHGLERMVAGYYTKHRHASASAYGVDHFAVAHRPHVFVDDAPADLPVDALILAVPQFIGGNVADRVLWEIVEQLHRGPTGRGAQR